MKEEELVSTGYIMSILHIMVSPYTPKGYQPRHISRVGKSTRPRYCRRCNEKIPAGTSHVSFDSHLSSGLRSDIHICPKCLVKLAAEVGHEAR